MMRRWQSMRRWAWLGLSALVVVGALVLLWPRRSGGPAHALLAQTGAAPAPLEAVREQGSRSLRLAAPEAAAEPTADRATAPERLQHGFVLDPEGTPVAGASIELLLGSSAIARSDDRGAFELELPAQPLLLRARWGELCSAPAQVDERTLERSLILQLELASVVEVHVVASSTRRPLAAARVVLEAGDPPRVVTEARTDPKGQVRLTAGGGGMFSVRAEAAGFGRAEREVLLSSASSGRVSVTLALLPEVAIQGTVQDAAGRPVAAADVVAWHVSAKTSAGRQSTDAEGRFRFDGLSQGAYRFEAHHPQLGAGQTPELELVSGVRQLVIALDSGRVLQGVVLDPAARPAPGTVVALEPIAPGQFRRRERWRVTSDAAGRFRFAGVPTSTVRLSARRDAQRAEPVELSLDLAGEVQLQLTEPATLSGTVLDAAGVSVPGAEVMARVAAGPSARAVGLGGERVKADEQGDFVLSVSPGQRYELFASSPSELLGEGFDRWAQAPLATAEAGAEDLVLVVPGVGSLQGWVEREDGSLPDEVTLLLGGYPLVSSSGGVFLFQGIPAGSYAVTVTGPSFEATELPEVVVAAGEVTALEGIVVRGGRALRGEVVSAAGEPVEGARVIASQSFHGDGHTLNRRELEQEPELRIAHSDASGRFVLPGVGAAARALAAEHDVFGRSAFVPIDASLDGTTLVRLVLQPAATLEGQVSKSGSAAEGFVLVVKDPSRSASFTAISDAEGRYRFQRLPAGEYQLSALNQSSAGDYDLQRRSVRLEPGQLAREDFEFHGGNVELTLAVREAPEPPRPLELRGSAVYLQDTARDGAYHFSGVEPGQYQACWVVAATAPEQPAVPGCTTVVVQPTPARQALLL